MVRFIGLSLMILGFGAMGHTSQEQTAWGVHIVLFFIGMFGLVLIFAPGEIVPGKDMTGDSFADLNYRIMTARLHAYLDSLEQSTQEKRKRKNDESLEDEFARYGGADIRGVDEPVPSANDPGYIEVWK